MTPRKPTAGFWITVAVVAVLAYPASAGPATWIIGFMPNREGRIYASVYYTFYRPLFWLCDEVEPLDRLMSWYAGPLD